MHTLIIHLAYAFIRKFGSVVFNIEMSLFQGGPLKGVPLHILYMKLYSRTYYNCCSLS